MSAAPEKPKKKEIKAGAAIKTLELNKALRREIAELRKGLQLQNAGYTLEMWESTGTQEMRDTFAARALIAESGNNPRALQRLGFRIINDQGQWKPKYVTYLAEKVLDTPGVKAIFDKTVGTPDEHWEKIIARQREIAVAGNDENAIRAAGNIAKIEGRITQKQAPVPSTVSLHVLVNNTRDKDAKTEVQVVETHDPLSILAHEPSDEGVAIDSSDLMPKELPA